MKPLFFPLRRKRRAQPFLLLEIRMLSVRLHEVDTTCDPVGITLLNEHALMPGDAPMLLEKIRTILSTDSTVRDLAVVMNSPIIRHQILGIPIMSAAERQRVVPLEMKHSFDSWESFGTISFWSAGKIKNDEVAKEYVLCAELPRVAANDLLAVIRENNFNVIGFTSHAQMVCHLLKECRTEDNPNVALLEVNEHEGSITLFHSNIWTMDRHFLIGSSADSESGISTGLDTEKLRLEVGRALQYFKQQVRSENIGHIFLYGSTQEANAIKDLLESFFRIPVTPVAPMGITTKGGDPKESKTIAAPLFDIPRVVAGHTHFEKYIDFLPPQWRQERQRKTRRAALASAAVLLYTTMGGIIFLFQREAAHIDREEGFHAANSIIRTNVSDQMHPLQSARRFALATEQTYEWSLGRHRTIAALVRELACAAPAEMRISDLEISEKGNSWQVKMQAEIRSANGSRSQQLFLKFQEQLRRFPRLKQLTWGGVQLADSSLPEDPAAYDLVVQNLLTFSMQGVLSPVPATPYLQGPGKH